MLSAFIDDGQAITAYIRGVERVYPAGRINFRRATASEIDTMLTRVRVMDVKERSHELNKFVVDHLETWSYGREVTLANYELMPQTLMERIDAIVRGLEGGDDDPEGIADKHATTEEREKN